MAFLQLALPGLLTMSGIRAAGLPFRMMRMAKPVSGHSDWTQFVYGRLEETSDIPLFYPLNPKGRLQMMAEADVIVKIPEGQALISNRQIVQGQILK